MGLCKCPKKRVTNQFCFEHRVNVCEHCLVSSHPKCIVQSYLKWLQDSDYEPACQLCKQDLANDECVRLLCYHVFHWSCIDKFAQQLPSNTAPAGYTCPTCNTGIFPTTNVISPVADSLRQTLGRVGWARMGLGLSPIEQNQDIHQSRGETQETNSSSSSKHSIVSVEGFNNARLDRIESFPNNSAFNSAFTAPRKLFDSTTSSHDGFRNSYIDHDDNKYKRRSALEWVSRWFKSRAPVGGRNRLHSDPKMIYKRWFILSVLIILGLGTLILIFIRLGRAHADADPLLDPHFNPNIRVGDSAPHDVIRDKIDIGEVL